MTSGSSFVANAPPTTPKPPSSNVNPTRRLDRGDLDELSLFARYKTEAARAYDRSLHCLKTIKKLHSDEERWKFYLQSQKEKLAILIERFELSKQRTTASSSAGRRGAPLTDPPPPPQQQPENTVGQTVFIGVENGKTIIYDTTPSNDDLRPLITRTQNQPHLQLHRRRPAEYQHLVTSEAYTFGKSTCIHKTYTFEEWSSQIASEPRP